MAMGLAKLDLDQNCKILHYPTVDIVPGRLDLGPKCKRWHYPTVVIGLGRLDLGQDCKGWRYPRVGMAKHVSAPEGWHYPRVGMAKRSRGVALSTGGNGNLRAEKFLKAGSVRNHVVAGPMRCAKVSGPNTPVDD